MRERRWLYLVAVVGAVVCLGVALWTTLSAEFPAGDYPGPPCVGCDSAGPPIESLAHGQISAFFSTQPIMGSASLLLRAPFVGLVTLARGSMIAQYRFGTFICLLVAMLLFLPAGALMLRRGRSPAIVLILLAAILVGLPTIRSVFWGHPEELLGGALAVAAVLAAVHRRGVAAGVLLGLAVATKQWGLLAALPVLIAARGQRRQVIGASVVVAGVLIVPMLLVDPVRFVHQNFQAAVAQDGVTPTNVWWMFHRLGVDPATHEQINAVPSWITGYSHPLTIAIALALAVLYWWRGAGRHPYDVIQLLAMLFLLRCLLDPLAISYHLAPFVLAMATFEGLRRRGIPGVTITSTAMIYVVGLYQAPLNNQGLMNALYLVWAIPAFIYVATASFRPPVPLGGPAPQLDQPVDAQRASA
jgi:Glycosyltransferase family 87